ncbi:hypothetical protein NHX12_028133, partial [Muraenolepis orangiensis]
KIRTDGVQDFFSSSTPAATAPPPETGHKPKRRSTCWGWLRLVGFPKKLARRAGHPACEQIRLPNIAGAWDSIPSAELLRLPNIAGAWDSVPSAELLRLPNIAQSCYMNSILQSLLTLRVFSQEIEQTEGFVAIRESRQSDNVFHKMSVLGSFKSTVALLDPEFEDNSQKTHLLFHMLNTRTCKRCGGQSVSMETFTNLSLDLEPGDSVSQALDRYLTETSVEFDCQCGAKTSGMQHCFLNLPNVVVLHLKRFQFNPDWSLEKVNDAVLLSRDLGLYSGTGNSPVSGHYVSDGSFRGEGDTPPDQWLSYDDEMVSWTSGSEVCQQRQCTAYLLFYERQRLALVLWNPRRITSRTPWWLALTGPLRLTSWTPLLLALTAGLVDPPDPLVTVTPVTWEKVQQHLRRRAL